LGFGAWFSGFQRKAALVLELGIWDFEGLRRLGFGAWDLRFRGNAALWDLNLGIWRFWNSYISGLPSGRVSFGTSS
jgi:hypothetical protein